MLVFTLNDRYDIEWHRGEPQPEIWQAKTPKDQLGLPRFLPLRHVNKVYADGDELELIRTSFVNLPFPKASYVIGVTWYGDLAQFIHSNLPYGKKHDGY